MAPVTRSWWARQWKSVVRLYRALGRRMPERLWVWWVMTLMLLRDPVYPSAQYAVRKAASDAALKDQAAMRQAVKNALLYPARGENWYRNTEASQWTALHAKERGYAAPSWRRELMVELAYLALRERGR